MAVGGWKKKLLIVVGVLVALGAMVGAAFLIDPQLQFKLAGKYRVYDLQGQLAPPFLATEVGSKTEVTLDALRGEPTMLMFFATKCSVCKKQMPAVVEFLKSDAASKVNLYLVHSSEFTRYPVLTREKITRGYLQRNGWTEVPALVAHNETSKAFHVQATPTLVVLDAEGRVTYAGLSDHSAARLERLAESALETSDF